MVDIKAALTATMCGVSHAAHPLLGVRANRLWEESQQERIKIRHCPTKEVVADGLTKLAAAEVLMMPFHAVAGNLSTRTAAHRTWVKRRRPESKHGSSDADVGNTCNHHYMRPSLAEFGRLACANLSNIAPQNN